MSARTRRLVPFVTLVLLAASATAQTAQEVARLQKTNAALLQKLNTQTRRIAELEARVAKLGATEKNKQAVADRRAAGIRAKVLAARKARLISPNRQVGLLNGLLFDLATGQRVILNPLMQGEYKKTLDKIAATRKKLDQIKDPAAARKVVDEMNRLLMDVRRALWEVEKANKAEQKKNAAERVPAKGIERRDR